MSDTKTMQQLGWFIEFSHFQGSFPRETKEANISIVRIRHKHTHFDGKLDVLIHLPISTAATLTSTIVRHFGIICNKLENSHNDIVVNRRTQQQLETLIFQSQDCSIISSFRGERRCLWCHVVLSVQLVRSIFKKCYDRKTLGVLHSSESTMFNNAFESRAGSALPKGALGRSSRWSRKSSTYTN